MENFLAWHAFDPDTICVNCTRDRVRRTAEVPAPSARYFESALIKQLYIYDARSIKSYVFILCICGARDGVAVDVDQFEFRQRAFSVFDQLLVVVSSYFSEGRLPAHLKFHRPQSKERQSIKSDIFKFVT